ncbi:MAG: hypothetical protein LBF94_01310, partial [Puniceicoccales bacterium]|nr:hypothetical protein [Puniceicoccales bacterium]
MNSSGVEGPPRPPDQTPTTPPPSASRLRSVAGALPPGQRSRTPDVQLADRLAKINSLAGRLDAALEGGTANALMDELLGLLKGRGKIPPDQSTHLIGQMETVFEQGMNHRDPALALGALDAAFLLYAKSDPRPENVPWMLGAIQHLPDIWAANPPLAALALEHFGDCVQFLPEGDHIGALIGQM